MLYKSLVAEKVDVTDRKITGFASIFGNKDSVSDVVCNGAFQKTIQENRKRFRHLWQHNTFEPPTATIRAIQEVGRDELPDVVKQSYPEATGGLMVTREYLETDYCERIYKGILAGAINEMSFMYDIVKSDMVRDTNDYTTYFLRELKLYETSDVNWGANEATEASKVELDRLLNTAKQYVALKTERTKEGRVLSTANVNKLRAAITTLEDILLSCEPMEDSSTEHDSAANTSNESLKSNIVETLKTRILLAQYELSEQ